MQKHVVKLQKETLTFNPNTSSGYCGWRGSGREECLGRLYSLHGTHYLIILILKTCVVHR